MEQAARSNEKQARMYFIAVVLPKELDEKVLGHKRWMHERFGCKIGLKSPAHITLVPPYWMEEEKEVSLQADLSTLADSFTAFPVFTNDFSSFKSQTLFIAVAPNDRLATLKEVAEEQAFAKGYIRKKESRPFHPHITIATRDLSKLDFQATWPRFQKMSFLETFEAGGLSLLKHNGRVWDVVFTALFGARLPMDSEGQP